MELDRFLDCGSGSGGRHYFYLDMRR
jgi:hypothetical protein